jgi:hypothetical protein
MPNPEEGIRTYTPGQGVNFGSIGSVLGTVVGSILGTPLLGALGGSIIGGLLETISNGLFSVKHESTYLSTETHYDVFKGERSVVSLRDIQIARKTYDAESHIQTRTLTFSKPIKAVGLLSTEEIPDGWPLDRDWITYSISSDQGNTWIPIRPQNRSSDVVEVKDTTRNLLLRIELRRPSDKPNETPVVKAYALKGLPT